MATPTRFAWFANTKPIDGRASLRIPTGFRPKAQGCEERATLGKRPKKIQPQRGRISIFARSPSHGVAIEGSPRRKPWAAVRRARAAERRKNPAPRHFSFAPAGAWKSPNTFPTARAVGYLLTLLRSYSQTFRRCSKIEMRPLNAPFGHFSTVLLKSATSDGYLRWISCQI